MTSDKFVLVFTVGEHRFGVDLDAVEEVLPAAALTALPGAPDVISGLMNLRGRIIPVIDLSYRFWRQRMKLHPSHRFIVVRTSDRTLILSVETVGDIVECREDDIGSFESRTVDNALVKGAIRDKEGLMLLHNLESCLTENEEDSLAEALHASTSQHKYERMNAG